MAGGPAGSRRQPVFGSRARVPMCGRRVTKPTFERLRRARHSAQYFDPSAPPLIGCHVGHRESDGSPVGS